MGKLVIALDGVVIKEVQLTQDKTTIGRRPHNDIVLENLAVSGEHAALEMVGAEVHLQDLQSTNGTHVNGRLIRRQLLRHLDDIQIGKYQLQYLQDESHEFEKTVIMKSVVVPPAPAPSMPASTPVSAMAVNTLGAASVKVLNGAAAGREVALTKVVTTVGKPGVQVASINRRPSGYVLAHVEGAARPTVNGQSVADEPMALHHGDVIALAGTQMQFLQATP